MNEESSPEPTGCQQEVSYSDYGAEYDCGYNTKITCDECKYGGGRKDPAAKCNEYE